jgi:hypothetical protein
VTVTNTLGAGLPNVTVKLYGPNDPTLQAGDTATTDADGAYYINYKYTGKAATFYVKATCAGIDFMPDPNNSTNANPRIITLKSNDFAIANFQGACPP